MQKLNALTAGIALLLTGCHPTQNSRTWEAVKAAPHTGPGVQHRSAAYAQRLHATLQRAGVEHKVVTFRFRYPDILKINRTGEDVAVIYKDTSTPDHPWWLMSENLWNPVWMPTGAVKRQVNFYVRQPAAIVSVAEFRTGSSKGAKPHHDAPAPAMYSSDSPDAKSVADLDYKPASKSLKKADTRHRHSAKNTKRANPRAPKSDPVPQVNPPTVRRRPDAPLRTA